MTPSPLPSFEPPTEVRSANMRAIRSRGNQSTEWRLRSLLIRNGYRGWKLHASELAGKPDFVFRASRVVIYIDGCFWHGCPLCGHTPKTNSEYWEAKIARNKQRDKRNTRYLRAQGFTVIRIWECALRKNPMRVLQRIKEGLLGI
jgi:DNA mismatch endonuclease (patch repair protein)